MNARLFALSLAAALAAAPLAAAADTLDLAVGGMWTSNGNASTAGVATLHGPGIGAPVLRPQVSLAIPFSNGGGRFAATAEGVFVGPGHTYAGAGLGAGKLGATNATGALFDVLAGTPVAPHVDLVGRYYGGFGGNAGTGAFAGLALRI